MTTPAKGDETRARILAAALELFRQRGFEGTTMREIAASAGVATGAAYYYFDSKDAIVLAFYDQAQGEMAPRLEAALAGSKDLAKRLAAILAVKLDYFQSSRRLLGALSAHTNPEHPLSPFSERTRECRERDMQVFEQAVSGSGGKIADDLRAHLPRLLWMYQMGVILFWIYDQSEGQRKTQALLDKSLTIIVRLIKISSLPLMRPLRRVVVDLVETVTE